MRWQLGEGTGRDAVQQGARLASVLGIPAPVGRVLWARGYREPSQAERFLEPRFEHLPNPFELKGIEAAVSRLIVTPSIHWVHHHRIRSDTDANYSTVLSLWDRLFASRSPTPRRIGMAIGVEGRDELSLPQLLIAPFQPTR